MHKSGLRAFGVSLMAVCSLMAIFALSAQAANLEDGGKAGVFKVEGLTTLVKGTKFVGSQEGAGTLLIHGKNAFIECKTGKVREGSEGISESEVKATVLFETCKVFEDTTPFSELTFCKIKEEMITANGIGKAKLHEGLNPKGVNEVNLYILFEGSGAEQLFATVEFTGEECALGINPKIKGSIVAKVDNGNSVAVHLIEFSKAITELFQIVSGGVTKGDQLKFGTAQALVTASATVELTGNHLNKSWSVV